jgi:hypothetical protein
MKLTSGIVALAILASSAWAQTSAPNLKTASPAAQQKSTAAPQAKPSGAVPAKASAAPAQTPAVKPATATSTQPAVKVAPAKAAPTTAKSSTATKTPAAAKATAPAKVQTPFTPKTVPALPKTAAAPVAATPKAAVKSPAGTPSVAAADSEKTDKSAKSQEKKYSMTGKRDPFISPVVNRGGGSGCSTGKKCLDIEQIALHGVVKSDNGMIAVVTNGLNKAYFLRENDPVFNGYVVKITVDSIVFKQTVQDRLGKPFTKDVVKRILTPAV